MNDILDRLEKERVRARRRARAHWLAAKYHQSRHVVLGVPAVIASAIVGTAIFATLSKDPAVGWKVATGVLSVLSAILTALQTFFGHADAVRKHSVAGADFGDLKRDLDDLMLEVKGYPDDRRSEALAAAKEISKRVGELEGRHPDLKDRFYDQAIREEGGVAAKP